MRLRVGAAMPVKGGRTALVVAEVREGRDTRGRLNYEFHVGHVERVQPFTVDAARDRVVAIVDALRDQRPCVMVDVGSPQGLALRQQLRTRLGDLHRPHAYPGTGDRPQLFSTFLQAYSDGRVTFEPGLRQRADLDRALVFYMGGGVLKDGVELPSEDEALVVATGLALYWPMHGGRAVPLLRPAKEESP